jgi:hypothetical protein
MYHKGVIGVSGLGAGALPFTGFNVVWLMIGAFALAMAAGALLRTLPKRKR